MEPLTLNFVNTESYCHTWRWNKWNGEWFDLV